MPKPDLRGKKPQPAPSQLQPRVVPGLGKVPFKTAELLLTPQEQRDHEALGIQPGEQIPESLKRKIAAAQAAARASLKDQPAGKPAGSAPAEIVDIASLPPEKQRELRQFVAAARLDAAQHVDVEKLIHPGMDPSVVEAIRMAAGKPGGKVEAGPGVVDQLKAQYAATGGGEADEDDPVEGGVEPNGPPSGQHGHCPRCQWDLADQRPPRPSPEDRAVFFAAVSGGQRFVKDYAICDGKLRVAFRSLKTSRGDLVLQQLAQDAARGLIPDRADHMRLFWDYRLCLSLLWLEAEGGERFDVAEAVDDRLSWPAAEAGTAHVTELPYVLTQLQDFGPLAEETVWRVVGQVYRFRFQALADGVEFESQDPSF